MPQSDNDRGREIITEIYQSWTFVFNDKDGRHCFPANGKECRNTRRLLKELDGLEVTDTSVLQNRDSIQDTLACYETTHRSNFPRLVRKCIYAAIAFVLLGAGSIQWIPKSKPEWNQEDWVVTRPTQLDVLDVSIVPEAERDFLKVKLKPGTKLEPLFIRYSSPLVRTPEGWVGYVSMADLEGGKKAIVPKSEEVFTEPGYRTKIGTSGFLRDKKKMEEDTPVTVIGLHTVTLASNEDEEQVLRMPDGSIAYMSGNHLEYPILKDFRRHAWSYHIATNRENLDKRVIGHPLGEVAEVYGLPCSVHPNGRGGRVAEMPQVNLIEGSTIYRGLRLYLDESNVVRSWGFAREPDASIALKMPLMDRFLALEPFRFAPRGPHAPRFLPEWWEKFGEMNMLFSLIFALVSFCVICLYTGILPFIVWGPFLFAMLMCRKVSNSFASLVGLLVLGVTYYFYTMAVFLMMDSLTLAILMGVVSGAFWYFIYVGNISINRCPTCHLMGTYQGTGNKKLSRETRESAVRTRSYWMKREMLNEFSQTKPTIQLDTYEVHQHRDVTVTEHWEEEQYCLYCGTVRNMTGSRQVASYEKKV